MNVDVLGPAPHVALFSFSADAWTWSTSTLANWTRWKMNQRLVYICWHFLTNGLLSRYLSSLKNIPPLDSFRKLGWFIVLSVPSWGRVAVDRFIIWKIEYAVPWRHNQLRHREIDVPLFAKASTKSQKFPRVWVVKFVLAVVGHFAAAVCCKDGKTNHCASVSSKDKIIHCCDDSSSRRSIATARPRTILPWEVPDQKW